MQITGKTTRLEAPSICKIEVKNRDGGYESIQEKFGNQRIAAKDDFTFKCKVQLSNGFEFKLKNVEDRETDELAEALTLAGNLVAGSLKELEEGRVHEDCELKIISKNYHSLFCRMRAIRYGNDQAELRGGFYAFQEAAVSAMKSGDLGGYETALRTLGMFVADPASGSKDLDKLLGDLDDREVKESESEPDFGRGEIFFREDFSNEINLTEAESNSDYCVADSGDGDSQIDRIDGGDIKSEATTVTERGGEVELMKGPQRILHRSEKEAKNTKASEKWISQARDKINSGKKYESHKIPEINLLQHKEVSKKICAETLEVNAYRMQEKLSEKSKAKTAELTRKSIKTVMHEDADSVATGVPSSVGRDKYCKPLDPNDPQLRTSGRRREDYGQDAITWGDLVKQEIIQRSVNLQLLKNMCSLLAADCVGVCNHSRDRGKRGELNKMRDYFNRQATVFSSGTIFKDDQELAAAATDFAQKCALYVQTIVDYSNLKRAN